MSDAVVLRNHHLRHIPELKVGEGILRSRFKAGCSMSRCGGKCCRSGVLAGVEERDRILENADLVRRYLDEDQEQNPANWFGEKFEDPDFPSGRAVETQVRNGACVFLDREARCVLQKAEAHAPSGVKALKPFYCRAFPVTVEFGVLTIDDEHCPDETRCCGPTKDGELTVFDVLEFELEYVLGPNGLSELRDYRSRAKG